MTNLDHKKITFIPFTDPTNNYIARMQALLSNFGVIEQLSDSRPTMVDVLTRRKKYDVLWVNFIENDLLNAAGKLSLKNLISIFSRTALMVLTAKQSVFVRHNHYPHATHHSRVKLIHALVSLYERMFDVVVTHSGAEVKGHRTYCPHPLYSLVKTKDVSHESSHNLPKDYYLVFGRIIPYKKIEDLVKRFPVSQILVAAGSVANNDYADSLTKMQQQHFIFMPGYLTESAAQSLVTNAKAVVISHADKDMVVSGTFFYAMALGKPVFAVQTDFLNWVKPRISPDLLFLAEDIEALCDLIEKTQVEKNTSVTDQSIQDEFGDEAVIAALSKILSKK